MSSIEAKGSREEQNDDECDQLVSLRNQVKELRNQVNELQITNANLTTIIQVNGPEQVCYDCFFGATEFKHIREHWRTTKHGPYGDYCAICEESVRNLLKHQRSKHPDEFKREAVRAFHLRESVVKDGVSLKFPRKLYDANFAARVRGRDNIIEYKKRQRNDRSILQEDSLEGILSHQTVSVMGKYILI